MTDHATGRGELTDAAWEALKPLLPATDGPGRPWRDHQQAINGALWRLRTGAPWRDLPERYGPWQTVYERFARWERDGTWARLLEQIQARDDSVGAVEWTVPVDSTINRSHQHAASARKRGRAREAGWKIRHARRPTRHWASRSGLTTKVQLACDGRGLPMAVVLTPGNVNDCTVFKAVLESVRVPRAGAGRLRQRPDSVIADKTSHADRSQAAAAEHSSCGWIGNALSSS